MAIPATPTQSTFAVSTGNGQNYVACALVPTATSYAIQRSVDGITYTTVSSPTLPQYLDTAVTLGTQYWYQMAAVNTSGTSTYTTPIMVIPAPTAEMTLFQLRLSAQQRADRVNSNFVTIAEWNSYLNQAMFELYDLLVTVYEDYFLAPSASFISNGADYFYPLPNGSNTFTNQTGNTFTPQAFYKLTGVDLAINSANNAFVTVDSFNFADRNNYVYPNSSSSIYGVFNLRYRLMGNQIEFIPTPSAGQIIRLWYIPRLSQLLQDTDTTSISISGWIEYVIVRAAYLALAKEESDTTQMEGQLLALKQRIEETASNRDAGRPQQISNTRSENGRGGWGSGFNGPIGGY